MCICLCTPVDCIVYVYTGEYNLSTFVDIVRDMGENGVREACRSNTTNAPDGMVVHFECPLLCLQPTPTRAHQSEILSALFLKKSHQISSLKIGCLVERHKTYSV